MTRLIEILISFAIVAVLMLLVGLVLPSSRHLSESVETNRKMTIVFDTLNSLRRFKDWNALVLRDPQAKLDLTGPVSGVGAKLAWSSDNKQVGDGSWEIVESVPGKSVKYAIEDNRRGHDKTTEFTFTPTGRGAVKRNVVRWVIVAIAAIAAVVLIAWIGGAFDSDEEETPPTLTVESLPVATVPATTPDTTAPAATAPSSTAP